MAGRARQVPKYLCGAGLGSVDNAEHIEVILDFIKAQKAEHFNRVQKHFQASSLQALVSSRKPLTFCGPSSAG